MAYRANARQQIHNEDGGRGINKRKKTGRRDSRGLEEIREVLEAGSETASNVVALPKQNSKEPKTPIMKVRCVACKGEMDGNRPFGTVLGGFVCQEKCNKDYLLLREEEMMTHPATKVTSF